MTTGWGEEEWSGGAGGTDGRIKPGIGNRKERLTKPLTLSRELKR